MSEIFVILWIVSAIWACSDAWKKLRGDVEKFLWTFFIVSVPFVGAGFWYYIQYVVVKEKRLEREKKRREKLDVRRKK